MDENDMVDVEVSVELAKRLKKLAEADGLTVDQELRKILADATV